LRAQITRTLFTYLCSDENSNADIPKCGAKSDDEDRSADEYCRHDPALLTGEKDLQGKEYQPGDSLFVEPPAEASKRMREVTHNW
jgi:hypothetical protein